MHNTREGLVKSQDIMSVSEPLALMLQKKNTVRATLKHHGGYTVTQADRGENQSMNNQSKYNKGDLT